MAFRKSLALRSGVSGEYIRITAFRWDRATREASALFSLYRDEATAASGEPLVPIVAKLRLAGDKFDAYLGNAALAGEADILARMYAAALVEPVISDFGADVFRDALGDLPGEPPLVESDSVNQSMTIAEERTAAQALDDAPTAGMAGGAGVTEIVVPPQAKRSLFQRALDFFRGQGYAD